MPTLEEKLRAALDSRLQRQILRRLPEVVSTHSDTTAQSKLVDFCSNDYLSLTTYPPLRDLYLSKLSTSTHILGSGGSRLLVNPSTHEALEHRLQRFFFPDDPADNNAALLFNSGFDANAGLFASIPQQGDVVILDEYIHASVHDGVRASRAAAATFTFAHNDVGALRELLRRLAREHPALESGESSAIVAVEALYSMDGTLAPLEEIVECVEETLPRGNGRVVVDEAHATGLYGQMGRGLTVHYGLEGRVFARLVTFGKALAGSGAVLLTTPVVKEYLLNYARPLIYTTALSYASVIAVDSAFDLLEDGTVNRVGGHYMPMSLESRIVELKTLARYTLSALRQQLVQFPPELVHLPHYFDRVAQDEKRRRGDPSTSYAPSPDRDYFLTPIIPLMTSRPRPLSAHLRTLGIVARPITWPTVPKGKDRVRVCLHTGNTRGEVDRLVDGVVAWAKQTLAAQARGGKGEVKL